MVSLLWLWVVQSHGFVPPVSTSKSFPPTTPHQRLSTASDSQQLTETFSSLYADVLPSWLLERCHELGWTHPTRIQHAALDVLLRDRSDAVLQAETGSGKTLSYLLPALAAIDPTRSAVQAMIVVPTRELGLQVARVAKRLAAASVSDDKKLLVMSVLQGSQNRRQRAWAWAEPPQMIVGTPEELCNMVRLGGIKRYNSVKFLVVDEVDACLLNNAGSLQLASSPLHELLSKHLSPTYDDGSSFEDSPLRSDGPKARPVTKTRQTVFASATIPQHRHFIKQCIQNKWSLRDPVHVCLRPGEQLLPSTLSHGFVVCQSQDDKPRALYRVLQKIARSSGNDVRKVLIFADASRPLEDMAESLAKELDRSIYWKESNTPNDAVGKDSVVAVLRYEDSLSQRASAIASFRGEESDEMALRLLFSTDLAARGLDIADVTHIVHLDLPTEADTYVHRSGRAGRLGRKGHVVSIIATDQEFVLQRLANKLSLDLACISRQKAVR